MSARSRVPLLAFLALCWLAPPRTAVGDEWADRFGRAHEAAKRGDPGGFDGLLAIAEAGVSAEYSEVALESLQCLLLEDARSWIRAMAKIDERRLERYVTGYGLVFMEEPRCVRSGSDYVSAATAAVQDAEGGNQAELRVRLRVLTRLREVAAGRQ